MAEQNKILYEGFAELTWRCEPGLWEKKGRCEHGKREGRFGQWKLVEETLLDQAMQTGSHGVSHRNLAVIPTKAATSGDKIGEGNEDGAEVRQRLIIYPDEKKDYWRNTYYQPRIIKDDGPGIFHFLLSCLQCS